jgi:uncharacterized membrane protein
MIVLETIAHRWYAFGFVAVFLWASLAERDWRRALRFYAVAAIVSWLAEVSSTHSAVPYGRYHYVALPGEAHLANIPLFVPLSFCVVVWAGRSLARAFFGARTPVRTILLGALLATVIDLVIDPMTLLGGTWFLGRLYEFEAGGWWFDVPWSNYAGWFAVSALILWVDELLETRAEKVVDTVRGPTLAAIIALFFVALAVATGHWAILAGQLAVIASTLMVMRRINN